MSYMMIHQPCAVDRSQRRHGIDTVSSSWPTPQHILTPKHPVTSNSLRSHRNRAASRHRRRMRSFSHRIDMGRQADGSEGGIILFQSCIKQSSGYRDRILKRYPLSKSQSRIFTTTDVQYLDVRAIPVLLSRCVQTSHHHSFAIAFPLLSQPLA